MLPTPQSRCSNIVCFLFRIYRIPLYKNRIEEDSAIYTAMPKERGEGAAAPSAFFQGEKRGQKVPCLIF